MPGIQPKEPVKGPVPVHYTPPKPAPPPETSTPPRDPIDAMKDMGKRDLRRHEMAEEAIREHFRTHFKELREKEKVDRVI
ncbi:MAG TPA: hypothetical protein ENI92_05775 [Bacteroidetes bacterium]|nr:hypothetical protein [Bacteroidota bacterium]